MVSGEAVILNLSGLHARPASCLTKIASEFQSDITITCQGKAIDAKKIMSVMKAGVKYGAAVTVICKGVDEKAALTAVLEGIKSGLDEVVF